MNPGTKIILPIPNASNNPSQLECAFNMSPIFSTGNIKLIIANIEIIVKKRGNMEEKFFQASLIACQVLVLLAKKEMINKMIAIG